MKKGTKVMLVNEHKILGDLLRASLAHYPELLVVAEYGNGREALVGARTLEPELVLTGMDLPGMEGVTLTRNLVEAWPDIKIIAVTHYSEKEGLFPFLAAGGKGYLSRYLSDEDLITTVKIVLNGDIFLSEEGFQLVAKEFRRLSMRAANSENALFFVREPLSGINLSLLSDREKQVLQLYVHGYSSKEMCQILFLSVNTVETYKKRIKEKLQLFNKTELMQYAIKQGLFEDWER
ncbi:hypothetical protein AT727_19745 [Desulfitobacterium hafniense]|uniref:Stage 0 sporulation protein A homolog n=1 Tax=Desulfitobacterium hafniense TaxID=49338 RepID=A0A0W1JLU7_DESHA|nr:response regulator transcription factor [Desulfitobacterium hafniense]KTE92421.1 hypothetical protein AT727_19745 [Desulfitobacterium hafniense]